MMNNQDAPFEFDTILLGEGKEVITESLFGRVVHGRKMGRQLGFPTANVDAEDVLLANGVYGVQVVVKEKQYRGVMNVGVKPTFGSTLKKTFEVHLLDFSDDLYGEFIECQLLFKVREEQKFASIDLLKIQITEDIHHAIEEFKQFEDFYKDGERKTLRKKQISESA
ncbi:riboflavin kinase [Peribacillus huizhouensis]|uniref:riboflavin kinase n=1 Tax=Peribacillus huizhouensis TaxID=1501239 RepID=A0ABR6CUM2_9BACI|nr:riboflavin kinase [Peribacillus huizhouensis]MBA9028705.1 riboflavin kinase/FMN adenylyltransferase [Peribacillus huizhouensis]